MALAGLVSYGASDDSESEDEEQPTTATTSVRSSASKLPAHTSPAIETSTETGPANASGNVFNSDQSIPSTSCELKVPAEPEEDLIDNSVVEDTFVGPTPLLQDGLGLPAPKHSDGTDNLMDLRNNSPPTWKSEPITVLSNLPLPKSSSSRPPPTKYDDDIVEDEYKKLPTVAELPKPSKKTHARISLPSLPDADSDEEEPKVKRVKQSASGKSGLIGLLPAPINFSVKEMNRPLIPHTLTKKPTATKPTQPKKLSKALVSHASDSDDEDNAVNFFNVKSVNRAMPTTASVPFSAASLKSAPNVASSSYTNELGPASSSANPSQVGAGTTAQYTPPHTTMQASEYAAYYQPQDSAPSSATAQPLDFETHQKLLQDEEFQKIRGRKNRHEEINIVDVNADDQMASAIDITKSITEEQPVMSYSKKNKDLPTSLSRRKHQITYLAFQAKERELELKNQWSQNKLTKRQTQAKYGF